MPHDVRSRYHAVELIDWVERVLERLGMPRSDAQVGAAAVVDADLRGIDTHGLANFVSHWHYASGLRDRSVNAAPTVAVLRESTVTAAWDADAGFGPVVARRAMENAIDRAQAHGVGTVTVRNGRHFGAAGQFARLAAEHGLLAMVMAHTAPSAFPPGAAVPLIGTNPIAFAAPAPDGRPPVVFDMAVTAAAGSKVQAAARDGKQVPHGWIRDREGRSTTDPARSAGLLLLGAGADGGGHKGYGLGLMVDIFSGLLSGTGSGIFTTFGPEWRVGSWFSAWRIDAFVDRADFDNSMKQMIDVIHASAEPGGELAVPGERSHNLHDWNLRHGVPLADEVVDQCHVWAQYTAEDFPSAIAGELEPRSAEGD